MKKQFNRVCCLSSTYSLLLYLIHANESEVNNTFFVFTGQFPKDIAMRFPNHCYIPKYDYQQHSRFYSLRLFMLVMYNKLFRIPIIREKTQLFAQDHTEMLNLLIGHHHYTMVAENPVMENILKYRQPSKTEKISISNQIRQLIFGPVYGHIWGYNPLCVAAIIEDEGSKKYLGGKNVIVVDARRKWNEKTKEEKKRILYYYGITDEEIDILKKKDTIVFTQPFVPEMTLAEYQYYMEAMINKYPHEQIVIKIHPREDLDYNKIFPDVHVCKLRAPAQLLDLCGIHFKKAVTYNSSAVYDFSYDIQIDWYGEEVKKWYGDAYVPKNATICSL